MKKQLTLIASSIIALSSHSAQAVLGTYTNFIKIDQIGYRKADQKIAVISDPITGYNAADAFTPGTSYQIRNWSNDAIAYPLPPTEIAPVAWKNGIEHTQSGDKVWQFDFSSFTSSGSFYVYDPQKNVRSGRFEIFNGVYQDVLKTAMRMFFYQRAGFAKTSDYVDTGYTDSASHLQDATCAYYDPA